MSAIRRGPRPADRFTLVSNGLARDGRLSFKARGLALYLLSHAEGWQTSVRTIAKANGVGREQVSTGLAELIKYGYLRRRQVRDSDSGVLGEAEYLIQCEPFEDHETPDADRGPETRPRETRHRETEPHKKNSSKNNISREDHPSGGDGSAAPGAHADDPEENPTPEEDEMPTATDPAQAQLFDVEAPEPPAAEARKPEGAQAVIAAYVEAWRKHNDGADPLRASKGRIARDAKAMLAKGEATQEELEASARAMASGPFSNLGVQLNIYRRGGRGGSVAGHSVPRPNDYEGWARGAAEDAERRARDGVPEEVHALRAQYVQAGVA